MSLLSKIFGPKKSVVESPKLGVLDLMKGESQSHIEADSTTFFHLFQSMEQNDRKPPVCDVLVIYSRILENGNIVGIDSSLREILRYSGASVAILATENSGDAYISAAADVGYGRANLVMTLNRNGSAFGKFFESLFLEMFKGESMLKAWVKLAPQNPHSQENDIPGTIFSSELGHICFAKD